MQLLLKNTYLLDVENVEKNLVRLWKRYQHILDNPNWEDLNEARAILYLTGRIYCEQIVPEAIRKRLNQLKKTISEIEFYTAIDSNSKDLKTYRKDELFCKLEKLYLIVKKYKNKEVDGRYYLDEEKFIELYNQYEPSKDLKIGFRGKYGEELEKLNNI